MRDQLTSPASPFDALPPLVSDAVWKIRTTLFSLLFFFFASAFKLKPRLSCCFCSLDRRIDAVRVDDERTRHSLHRGHFGLLDYNTNRW